MPGHVQTADNGQKRNNTFSNGPSSNLKTNGFHKRNYQPVRNYEKYINNYKPSINIDDPNDWPALGEATLANSNDSKTQKISNGNETNSTVFSKKKIIQTKSTTANGEVVETTLIEETDSFSKLVISKELNHINDDNNNKMNSNDAEIINENLDNNQSSPQVNTADKTNVTDAENGIKSHSETSTDDTNKEKPKKKNSKSKWKVLNFEPQPTRPINDKKKFDRSRDGRDNNQINRLSRRKDYNSNNNDSSMNQFVNNGKFNDSHSHQNGNHIYYNRRFNNYANTQLTGNANIQNKDSQHNVNGNNSTITNGSDENSQKNAQNNVHKINNYNRNRKLGGRIMRNNRSIPGFKHRNENIHHNGSSNNSSQNGYIAPFYAAFNPMQRVKWHPLDVCLREQIEYYFSEENLQRDFFLRRKMDKEGYLPISLIASFYRVQAMTMNINHIIDALRKSEEVELSTDNKKVRAKKDPKKWPILDSLFVLNENLFECSKNVANLNRKDACSIDSANESRTSGISFGSGTTDLHPNVPDFIPGQPYGYMYDGAKNCVFIPKMNPAKFAANTQFANGTKFASEPEKVVENDVESKKANETDEQSVAEVVETVKKPLSYLEAAKQARNSVQKTKEAGKKEPEKLQDKSGETRQEAEPEVQVNGDAAN